MTFYVDPLVSRGWILRGRPTKSCHLFTSEYRLDFLHEFAERLGLKRIWFQDHYLVPHYDLTESRRLIAVRLGAVSISGREMIQIARARMEQVGYRCPWCSGRGWTIGDCHPREECGGCDGAGRIGRERFLQERAERLRTSAPRWK